MSKCSDTAGNAHSWGNVCSPPPTSSLMKTFSLLETAAEQMMVHTDFQAAFGTCNKGLEGLASMELEDNRCLEYKAGFCTVGIQALAELNQWRAALPWVLQQYEDQEKIPAQIVQLCILLYSKVGEPAVMQETARVWLHCPSNRSVSGFRTVAELYLLHVLVPLKYREEAEELILGEIGTSVFTEHQRQTALEFLEEKEQQNQELPLNSSQNSTADVISARGNTDRLSQLQRQTASLTLLSSAGSVLCKLEAMLKFLYRKLLLTHSGSFRFQSIFFAAMLLYLLFLRLDPALPSSFMWIFKLFQLLKQMWRTMFAPYYQAITQSKGL
ncbi:peroxisome assembly protein 26 isoform X1 [Takifugu rubripes]|uniref:peroxisome assembly protein 26 isoform X1 n=1 Tax=Takifugu rubripes TaxID=31033 RepID=UPI0011453645|nr:peroxisome assembly protein 26 isoform X1 [Takifugu rubripes]